MADSVSLYEAFKAGYAAGVEDLELRSMEKDRVWYAYGEWLVKMLEKDD